MTTTVNDLQTAADQLREALADYESFLAAWRDGGETNPNDGYARPAERDSAMQDLTACSGVAITKDVLQRYRAARDAMVKYVQQVRDRERSNWSAFITATESVRKAILAVHAAGYGPTPRTGECGYLLTGERCPARRVSMNAGSSPVTFGDRIAQYRAVATRFGIDADVVYYPGSGHDVSPTSGFPRADVTYVDVDVAAMDDLVGYDAVWADATGYELAESADVIVLRNAGLVEEAIVETNLRARGWVLANDHLESASHVARMDGLELVGVVPDDWSGDKPRVKATDLDDTDLVDGRRTSGQSPATDRMGSPLDLYVFRERSDSNSQTTASNTLAKL